jgi:choline dehydrogenase
MVQRLHLRQVFILDISLLWPNSSVDPGFFANGYSAIALKTQTSSRGYVELTGSHPQDLLNIQKRHFLPVDSENVQADLAAIRGGIRVAREIATLPHIADHILEEIYPGSDKQTDEELNEYIFENIFCQ